MSTLPRVKITGTGMYVPPKVVTNDDLAKLMDTSDEWIQQRTGIKERHYIEPEKEGQQPSDLAVEAGRRAMEAAGVGPNDIDCIIVPTLSGERYFPGTAFFVQRKLGFESNVPAIDLRAQCSGFIYGLQVANAFIQTGVYKRILLIGVEVHSTTLEFSDRGRDVAVIFGDGAGAVVLEKSDDDTGIMSVHLHSQGEHAERLWVPVPATGRPKSFVPSDFDEGLCRPIMEGRYVFKHACVRLPESIMEAMSHNDLTGDDIDWFLFHQANLRINEFVGQMMGIPAEKCPHNIDKFGNCSAASIPMLLDENVRNGNIKKGDTVMMSAFGSGFTWGSAVIKM